MAYVIGGYGPWTTDDSGVVCDGFLLNGNLLAGPTADGVGRARKHVWPFVPDPVRVGLVLHGGRTYERGDA